MRKLYALKFCGKFFPKSRNSGLNLLGQFSLLLVLCTSCFNQTFAQTLSPDRNYVAESVVKVADKKAVSELAGLSAAQVSRSVTYVDGLGRPIQVVQVSGSPKQKDIVQHIEYDALGREVKKYLPYTDQGVAGGSYRTNAQAGQAAFYAAPPVGLTPVSNPYSQTLLEASPLNRVLEQGAPGAAWQVGSGHTVRLDYASNDATSLTTGSGRWARRYSVSIAADGVRTLATAGGYALNQLFVSISKDENWVTANGKAGTTEEYKDKADRVVLKRTFNLKNGALETLSTYYVYDDLGNLCFVLPPGASPDAALPNATALNNFCYQYRYDGRQRLIEKRLPGRGLESMVYNKLDQLVALQNADLLARNYWHYTKYDALGREILTGWWRDGTSSINRVALQARVDTQTVLWEAPASTALGYDNLAWPQGSIDFFEIKYYDNYQVFNLPTTYGYQAYLTNVKSDRTYGLLTVSMNRSVENSTNRWNVFYYDKEGRVIQTQSNNHVGGTDIMNNQYDFAGQLIKTQRNHTGTPTVSLATLNTYTYDHQGRKIDTRHKIGATVDPLDSPMTEIARINSGGTAIQYGTETWSADQYYTGGSSYTKVAAIGNTENDVLYHKERYGNFTYNIPVPASGSYTVELHFVELYHQAVGARVFNVNVESGQFTLQNLDLYKTYGYLNAAMLKAENIQVTDGLLTIAFSSVVDYAKISGITVFRQSADAGIILAHNEYNELGQLIDKKLHSRNGTSYLQSIDYRYNNRGWLKSINNVALTNDAGATNDDSNDQFGMTLQYESSPIPQYNGNISQMNWKTGRSVSPLMTYDFRYDQLNRLTEAVSSTGGTKNSHYGEYLRYNNMGNIEFLGRYASIGGVRQQIDSLQYTYEGNRHRRIDDLSTSTQKALGFNDQGSQAVNEITYDAVGKIKLDANKKITTRTYSSIETIQKVVFDNGASQLDYEYDRTGNKLKKKYTVGTSVTTTDYINGIQYDTPPGGARTLSFIQTEEGRVRKSGTTYTYEYDLKDHLGNTRITIVPASTDASQTTPEVIQESCYYAFGMEMPSSEMNFFSGTKNKYLYNGKELQEELGQLDYGARFYDPAIGRWDGMDAKSEKYSRHSPYSYAINNPIIYIDPDGNDIYKINQETGEMEQIKTKNKSHSYYLVGTDRNETLVGKFKYNKDGLIKLPSSFSAKDGENNKFGFTVKEGNENQAFITGDAMGSLLGALAETGTSDLTVNGFSLSNGSSPDPSVSHKAGKNGDLRYLSENENGEKVILGQSNLDMSRQNNLNDALYKFGWKDMISEKFKPYGSSQSTLLNHTSSATSRGIPTNHSNHLHLQGYSPRIKVIYGGGELQSVTITAKRNQ